ncbi:uncharacterized protein LOC143020876 isoform X1 [Oratosquilla oratoria]|uniref:uncharacterized protein LOC143020876 isoform X1 n=1 Tax=Oratosquilla oratoria TaxID=337810 RepID=UPI003F770FCE
MMAQKKTAGTLLSGLHVLVILSALVLVTVLVTCLIGHSKMGARLWSDRRGGNRSSNPSSPRHTHHTSLTPANFTHSTMADDEHPTTWHPIWVSALAIGSVQMMISLLVLCSSKSNSPIVQKRRISALDNRSPLSYERSSLSDNRTEENVSSSGIVLARHPKEPHG